MALSTLKATLDAWVDQDRPAQNNGQAAYLWLNGDGSHTKKAYIFFGRPFPPLANIGSATLTLYVYTPWGGAKTLTIKRATTKWSENELLYTNAPTVTATHSTSQVVTSPVAGQAVTFDLTTMLADVSAGGAWFGIEVTVDGTATVKLYAAENSDQTKRAELDIDWSKIPEDPVNVVPANSQAVSLALPVHGWQFDTKDHSAVRSQSSSQLQIATDSAFSSIEYDSGQQSNTLGNWDLSLATSPTYNVNMGVFTVTIASPAVFTRNAHGFVLGDPVFFTTTGALPTGLTANTTYYVSAIPGGNTFRVSATSGGADINTSGTQSGTHTLFRYGLQDSTTRYARVKVWDDKGQVSAYSDTVTFQRKKKGTLTMSVPALGSPVVNETTPPITWNLTSTTQEAFELRLYRRMGNNALQQLWRLPKITSTATSYQLPRGYLHEGTTFNIDLRVWDNVDRAVTPGDPDYLEISRDFTYVRGGGVVATTGLTATPVAGGAGIQFDFARTNPAPVWFALKEDGVVVNDRIDPTAAFVSGTSYRYTHWAAKPETAHSYEVEAVDTVGGVLKHSSGNSTIAAYTPSPVGITLVDASDGTFATVIGPESHNPDMSIAEQGTTYTPIGSRRMVRIIDSVGGYQGSVSGQLQGAAKRDDFLTIKGRSPTPLRLIVGDVNIEVNLEEVSVPPRGDIPAGGLYDVGFSFFQTDASNTFAVTGLG